MDRALSAICLSTIIAFISCTQASSIETPYPTGAKVSNDINAAIARCVELIRINRLAGAGNSSVEVGYDKFIAGDYSAAAVAIESVSSNIVSGNFLPFRVLAISYEKSGLLGDAEAAYEIAVSMYPNDPASWGALERLKGLRSTLPRNIQRPKWKTFIGVLEAGDPLQWTAEAATKRLPAYQAYIEELKAAGETLVAGNVSRGIVLATLNAAEKAHNEGKDAEGISAISLVEAAVPNKAWPSIVRREKESLLVSLYLDIHAHLNAAAVVERLARSGDADPSVVTRLTLPILYATLTSVSWDLESGKRITNDPEDFLGLSQEYRDEIGRPKRPSRQALEFPYGMTNPHEDEATISENIFANRSLPAMLKLRIESGNLELPIKVLIVLLIDSVSGLGPANLDQGPYASLRVQLEHAMSKQDVNDVAVSTRDAFDVALLIDDLLRERQIHLPLFKILEELKPPLH
jgi:hypothetical protein